MVEELNLFGDTGNDEYEKFVDKFKPKKTTDDCYTPPLIYDAVRDYVCRHYGLNARDFVRPFWPGGDYEREEYPEGCVVVDNPPFSIMARILKFYVRRGVRFFLFAPTLTLFSSSSSCTAIPLACTMEYENGAKVNTSFLTNLDPPEIRLRSAPDLYRALKDADDRNRKRTKKQFPKYSYDHHVITSPFVGALSRLGIEFSVPVAESVKISDMDAQKAAGRGIFGSGYLVSDNVFERREEAERIKARREYEERERIEMERIERETAERLELSDRERQIVAQLTAAGGKNINKV